MFHGSVCMENKTSNDPTLFITSASEVVYYPTIVCLFVCLSVVYLLAISPKTTDQIF